MATNRSAPKRRMGRLGWGLRVLGGVVIVLLVLLAGGYAYQVQVTAADFERFPAPGQVVDVGGYSLHVFCQGEGSPTVVVDAGNGDFSLGWSLVQPQVARFARVCTYDRAGYGWSDPGPAPRTARQIAGELHTALANAGLQGPYLLVGHSLGGYTVRMYAHLYPQEVVGMVLVDAGHEEQRNRLPPEYAQITRQQTRYLGTMGLLARLGILRLMGRSAGEEALPPYLKQLPADARDLYVTMISHPSYFAASLQELKELEETCTQVDALGDLGDLPLVVLTAESTVDPETLQSIGLPPDFPVEQIRSTWLALQGDLASLSTKSTHLIADGSGHAIHLDRPDLVVAAIQQVLAQARELQRADLQPHDPGTRTHTTSVKAVSDERSR